MPQKDLWGIQYIVVKLAVKNKEVLATSEIWVNKMSDFKFENGNLEGGLSEKMLAEQDLLLEQIVENLNHTPVGQVLKKIASLPEVRQQKILNVREQLTAGDYDLSERLDIVLDKVLEELTA